MGWMDRFGIYTFRVELVHVLERVLHFWEHERGRISVVIGCARVLLGSV